MAAPRSSGKSHPSIAGTAWRTVRTFLFVVIIVGAVYALFSGVIAISTANKCGDHLNSTKTWDYWPPGWDCTSSP